MGEKPIFKASFKGMSLSAWKNDDNDKRPHVTLQRSKKIDGEYTRPIEMKMWYNSVNVLHHLTEALLERFPEFAEPLKDKDLNIEFND